MAIAGALQAVQSLCSSMQSVDGRHRTNPNSRARRSASLVFLGRNRFSSLCRSGAEFANLRGRGGLSSSPVAFLPSLDPLRNSNPVNRDGLSRPRAQQQPEVVDMGTGEGQGMEKEEEDGHGIGEREYGRGGESGMPERFNELMKDEGVPPNYWLWGVVLGAVYLVRRAMWAEVKRWAKFAGLLGVVLIDFVLMIAARLIKLGGEPLLKVVIFFGWVGLTISNLLRLTGAMVPFLPVMLAVSVSSLVLLVGESVSDTYSASHFPSRDTLDLAGLLGLGGFVGLIPAEFMLLGLVAITLFLFRVKRVNPVAGFTPAVAAIGAVSTPYVRYPLLGVFVGFSMFRYWRLGYMSQGAVMKPRTAEYPRVLKGLLYIVFVALVSRVFFDAFDWSCAAIRVLRS